MGRCFLVLFFMFIRNVIRFATNGLQSGLLHSYLTNLPSLDSMGRDIRKQNKACMYTPLGK